MTPPRRGSIHTHNLLSACGGVVNYVFIEGGGDGLLLRNKEENEGKEDQEKKEKISFFGRICTGYPPFRLYKMIYILTNGGKDGKVSLYRM